PVYGQERSSFAAYPPLTEALLNRFCDFYGWRLGTLLTRAQCQFVRDQEAALWQTQDENRINAELLGTDTYDNLRSLGKSDLDKAQQLYLASRQSYWNLHPDDTFAQWEMGVYRAANTPLISPNANAPFFEQLMSPPTTQISDAMAEFLSFAAGEVFF